MLHTGWFSTCQRSCRNAMDWWKHTSHLLLKCATGSPHHCRQKLRDLSPGTGTVSQATMTNGIDRLPCSYLCRSSHWISKSMSGLQPCCHHRGGRVFMAHWASTSSSWSPLWINAWRKMCKIKTWKWLTVSGQSKKEQANKHTHARAQWSHTMWDSLKLAPIKSLLNQYTSARHLITCTSVKRHMKTLYTANSKPTR